MESGVPQGSHLGPLLFNIFIHDITKTFPSGSSLLFADDLKIFSKISTIDDSAQLQLQIDLLSEWCTANCMDLNVQKCQVMRFYRSRNPLLYNYKLHGQEFPTNETVRDLGVTLDSTLSFVPHIGEICNKALKMLGFVKRVTADFTNVKSLKTLYCSLVRSHLEYCSSVWSPYYAVHINKIEQIQHKFLRYAAYKLNIPCDEIADYTNLENTLNLNTLSLRRRKHDLKILYNIINYRLYDPNLLGKINFHVPPCNTRHNYIFTQPFHRTNYGLNSPISRLTRIANLENLDIFGVSYNQFLADLDTTVT